ncbi:hypothetical protein CRG98_008312 [Punica granatum]|uniref:Uncharacterized protein n=1 Tax=Punica granatum TaxID=22663 RepID=A0A2I0KS49_PUNGR|nr:hypothetical protein CRG98_008312 [Punica granatum]
MKPDQTEPDQTTRPEKRMKQTLEAAGDKEQQLKQRLEEVSFNWVDDSSSNRDDSDSNRAAEQHKCRYNTADTQQAVEMKIVGSRQQQTQTETTGRPLETTGTSRTGDHLRRKRLGDNHLTETERPAL